MPKPNQPARPRSSEDILREMEEMAKEETGSAPPRPTPRASGGGLKSFLDFFVKVVPDEASMPPSAPTAAPPLRTGPRVADLVAGEDAPRFVPPPNAANLAQRPFDEIYHEADLVETPCSVDELARLLENPTVANQPLNVKVIAVNLALAAKGLGHDAPIADAVRRDRALDAYQQMLDARAKQIEQTHLSQIEQLTRETEEYLKRKQTEIEALRAAIFDAQTQSRDFAVRREAEERRLAELISPFLADQPNPVTIGNQAYVTSREPQSHGDKK